MAHPQINGKTLARIAAIQTIYQFTQDSSLDINTILTQMKELYKSPDFKGDHDLEATNPLKLKPSYRHMEELVQYTHTNLETIDGIIARYLHQDHSARALPILLHSLLRVAICELVYFTETPQKVILNEYTDIASDMLTENEIGFVNSLLHNYSHSEK